MWLDESWDWVEFGWVLDGLLLEPDDASEEDQRNGDTEDQSEEDEDGGWVESIGGLFEGGDEVDSVEDQEDYTRVKQSCSEGTFNPMRTIEHFVDSSGIVTSENTHEVVEKEHHSLESSSITLFHESQTSTQDCQEAHSSNLDSGADQDGKKESMTRWSENISG